MQRFSITGVQEKFSAVIEDGKIRLGRDCERSTHILKPVPWNESLQARRQLPANEHLTMQIASQVYGIPTAGGALCLTSYGQPAYITKRFDILPDGTKLPAEDFASVIGRNEVTDGPNFKYSGSYEDIASAIRTYVAAWRIDMERFFDLVVFNYIYGNGDSHLKNFSLVRYGQDYRLAPAYDLLNTGLHMRTSVFGLDGGLSPNIEKSDVYDKTGHPCRLDFERFGARIGIIRPRLARILDKYMEIPAAAQILISRSFLSDKLKRSYLRSLTERTARFVRLSLD
ncbi:MAG: HipA domain-containing protein [Porphyromonadaceae bacterium]|nr:HipA domain-containing protein [Porphyromonadaceae bacterium]